MPETIGQRLKQAREARRLTLEKASEATRIRPHYLQALENDDYSVMISAAQGRGFLRLYADFLELNLDEIMAEVRAAEPSPTGPASPAPAADTPPAAESTAQPAPASPPDVKPGRPGFWSRLLRRSAPAAPPAAESQPQAEPPAPIVEETASAAEPVSVVEEPAKPARKARKPKPAAPAPDEEKPKTTRRSTKSAAGKKKRTLRLK